MVQKWPCHNKTNESATNKNYCPHSEQWFRKLEYPNENMEKDAHTVTNSLYSEKAASSQ